MPDLRRANCRHCGGHRDVVGSISWSGSCLACALDRVAENLLGLYHMEGPAALRWRQAMAASVGAVLLDAIRTEEHPSGRDSRLQPL